MRFISQIPKLFGAGLAESHTMQFDFSINSDLVRLMVSRPPMPTSIQRVATSTNIKSKDTVSVAKCYTLPETTMR